MTPTNSPERIAVTGASGAVGSAVAAGLTGLGRPPRLIVRNPARAPQIECAEVRVATGYGDAEGMAAALEGVDTVYLVPGAEAPDRVAQHITAVDAARAAGVGRIVYLSFVGASPEATFTLARDHFHTEQHIRASGLAWTFLRMNLYLDLLPSMVSAEGVISGPAGSGRVAAVARADVAAASVAVLTQSGHDGRTLDLTGPEALSLAEVAEIMSRHTGRPVRFHDESDEEAYASRASYGAPAWEVAGWVSSYQAIRDGSLAEVSSTVHDLTGREPSSLQDFLATRTEQDSPSS